MKGKEIWMKINQNKRLRRLEQAGFRRGDKRHKTMNVTEGDMFNSLKKQWDDLRAAYLLCDNNKKVLRCIADLRNDAGCLFLKIEEVLEAEP